MELPPLLREGVDRILDGIPVADIRKAAELLSRRYRGQIRDGRFHLSDTLAANAYLATRLPATYAAIRASLAAIADIRPGWEPQSLLDIGAGPGSAWWAACDQWPSIERATMVEACDPIRRVGEELARRADQNNGLDRRRHSARLADAPKRGPRHPVLCTGRTRPGRHGRLTERLWADRHAIPCWWSSPERPPAGSASCVSGTA